MDVYYTVTPDDVPLNALVDRYASHARGRSYRRVWYEPIGRLLVPTLTLQTEIDPLVPLNHGTVDAKKVSERGLSDNLVQRVSTAFQYGHCDFSVDEDGCIPRS
jgi:hypothetical protein